MLFTKTQRKEEIEKVSKKFTNSKQKFRNMLRTWQALHKLNKNND